jgi:metal-responsive CopG/Arc/MetJ family transcriptional regulator
VKTAISVPDELFEKAEAAAKRLHVSRSELYARALADFLSSQDPSAVTAKLNEIYSSEPAKIDELFQRAQMKLMSESEW